MLEEMILTLKTPPTSRLHLTFNCRCPVASARRCGLLILPKYSTDLAQVALWWSKSPEGVRLTRDTHVVFVLEPVQSDWVAWV